MQYRYITCDVFTDEQFGGNPLAVFLDAQGLSTEQMQKIAREFNYSETTFVFPGTGKFDRQVRIFTPAQEIPFAGHPNIGTAYALVRSGETLLENGSGQLVFDEAAGEVPITLSERGSQLFCELRAPQRLELKESIPSELVAKALSLEVSDIVVSNHSPTVATVGLPFIMVELNDLDSLARARVFQPAFDEIRERGVEPDIHCYVSLENQTIRARMFAPHAGVPEDPATGSANCALVAYLAHLSSDNGALCWEITQGVEMGRKSTLFARVIKHNNTVQDVFIAGTCVVVCEGVLSI